MHNIKQELISLYSILGELGDSSFGGTVFKSEFMNLGQILGSMRELADDECIFARKPWSSTSEAVTSLLAEDYRIPSNVSEQGLEYFLEVHVAKEVLELFGDRPVSEDEKVNLLVFYAENDAYPDWVFAI